MWVYRWNPPYDRLQPGPPPPAPREPSADLLVPSAVLRSKLLGRRRETPPPLPDRPAPPRPGRPPPLDRPG